MKKFVTALIISVLAVTLGMSPVMANSFDNSGICGLDGADCSSEEVTGGVKSIITTAIGLIGLVAVGMIIYGGFLFVTSAGDAGKIQAAKNTILYSVIGLIIAILAFAIVTFVMDVV